MIKIIITIVVSIYIAVGMSVFIEFRKWSKIKNKPKVKTMFLDFWFSVFWIVWVIAELIKDARIKRKS